MKLATLSKKQVEAAERTLSVGTWAITAMAITFSLFTVTPLVERVTPEGWKWSAVGLSLLVDVALVIVIRMDAAASRLGAHVKGWPAVLRWLTGVSSVLLNIGDSALKGDRVGVAVHAVAPLVLVAVSEAGPKYRQAITDGLDRIEREQREEAERKRVHEQCEREARQREQREREQQEREEREREQDRAERLERERLEREQAQEKQRLDHEARMAREQREAEEARRRDEVEREERRAERERRERQEREAREQAERARREQEQRARADAERAAREQQEREARERAEQLARERRERRAVNTGGSTVNTPKTAAVNTPKAAPVKAVVNNDKLSETDARALIVNTPGASVRDLADKTGWSIGWVSQVRRESGEHHQQAEDTTAA